MNKIKRDEFSNGSEENGIRKNIDVSLDYCDVCFIAFGSQEKRIYMGKNVVHLDCANKSISKKEF
jgi:hypothetical protein